MRIMCASHNYIGIARLLIDNFKEQININLTNNTLTAILVCNTFSVLI